MACLAGEHAIDSNPGFHLVLLVHSVHQGSEPRRPVEFFKDSVDCGEAHHVKGFLLIKEYYGPFLVCGVDEIDGELDMKDVLPPISCGYDMFVVSGHLYRPLLLSQPWELEGKIKSELDSSPTL